MDDRGECGSNDIVTRGAQQQLLRFSRAKIGSTILITTGTSGNTFTSDFAYG
jgi:hypothetical protein